MKKFKFLSREKINKLPKGPGVYCFQNKEIFYIGKASNIKERVKNHFQRPITFWEQILSKETLFRPAPVKASAFGQRSRLRPTKSTDKQGFGGRGKIGFIKTDSEIEALILETNLIKKYQPKYNVIWKDDKNYFFIAITKEDFPRIFITHQPAIKQFNNVTIKQCNNFQYVGPFVDGKALKQTLEILRKVFPYRSCKILPKRPCLWYHLERCPGLCLLKSRLVEEIPSALERMKKECQKNAENVFKILQGEKNQVLKILKKEMKKESRSQDFERAAKIRDQISVLEKVLKNTRVFGLELEKTNVKSHPWDLFYVDWKKIEKKLKKILKVRKEIKRIEAYDVSNIQGKEATGAMITFINGKPEKNFYRRFKISGKFTPHQKFGGGPNDIAMIKEVLNRRFKHPEWPYPDLILIDGGIAQLSAVQSTINNYQLTIPIIALAKRKNELFIENFTHQNFRRKFRRARKKPILLKSFPRELFNLILQLRDEAHRFALIYHKKLREKKLVES